MSRDMIAISVKLALTLAMAGIMTLFIFGPIGYEFVAWLGFVTFLGGIVAAVLIVMWTA